MMVGLRPKNFGGPASTRSFSFVTFARGSVMDEPLPAVPCR